MPKKELTFYTLKKDAPYYAKFLAFHEQYPEIYDLIVTVGKEATESHGYETWSMGGIFEILRWYGAFDAVDPSYRINWMKSHYSALVVENEPELAAILRTRND